jgi:adenosylcobyric acid synthase
MKAIMVVGTTSHAGKSFLTAALCRILSRKSWHVAPFKGQNMALNAYVTPTGGEIGYAQAVQAWAAGTTPRVEMNPILLKPQGNMTSQVIMMGKPVGKTTASDYYEHYFDRGWEAVTSALTKLSAEFDLVVLTNMRVAKYLNAPTLLVVDIDRGGAFAHVVGTLELLEPDERDLIKGIVINKFRGIKSILDPGIEWLEKRTGIPVVGVIPWTDTLFPAEDSLDLLERRSYKANAEIKIAIVRLPRISNFTDFDPLDAEPTVSLRYVNLHESLGHPDAVIIPGSKTTISDLIALQESGMGDKLRAYADAGGIILGICGGFQMLGEVVLDPERIESEDDEYPGLNLLPVKTIIARDKTARQRQVVSNYPQSGLPITGYEIHQGTTRLVESNQKPPHLVSHALFNDASLGMVNHSQSIWGCYLHGLFDNGPWRRAWLNYLRQRRGLYSLPTGIANYREQREGTLDAIADLASEYLDLSTVLPDR